MWSVPYYSYYSIRLRPVHHHRKKGTMEILLLHPTLARRDCIPTPERGNEKYNET